MTEPAVLPPPGSSDVLYLIDLSGYVFRAYHAIAPLSSSKGEPTHAVLGTVNMLQKVVNERQPTLLAVAMDGGGPSFRKEIDARYKATRPPAPPDLSQQLARCEQIVRAYNIPIYQSDGIEADDLIAAAVGRADAEGLRVVIVSADKDLMQLVHDGDDRVVLWDSMRDRTYGPAEVTAKFGVPPSQLRDLLALMGDSSDNVPGVPSVGPKTAADLLREWKTIDGIYAHLGEIKRNKVREMLTQHEADARISQELVTLKRDVPLEWSRERLTYGGADIEALRRLFIDLEFSRLLDQINAAQVLRDTGRGLPMPGTRGGGRAAMMVSRAAAPVEPAVGITRSYRHVVALAEVEALVAAARDKCVLAIDVATSSTDPLRGDVLGVSLSVAPGEGIYVPISHRYLGAPAQIPWADLARALAPAIESREIRKVSYDLKRVENILARRGLSLRGAISDPMLAAYLLDPEAPHELKDLVRREFGSELPIFEEGTGRKRDRVAFDQLEVEIGAKFWAPRAELALAVVERLEARIADEGLGELYKDLELPLTHVLAAMEQKGVLVDTSRLGQIAADVERECTKLELKAQAVVGRGFSIRSRDQLEALLFDELKLPVIKRTLKGGRSTDAAVLEELTDKHPLPGIILEYRELDKLKGTYLEALPRAVNPETGRIHTRFEQAVAATGRLSSTEPNLQNIPVRTDVGRLVRSAFIAPPGHVILSADYSQIELRVLAHLAHDEELGRAFREKLDVHTHTASLVFEVGHDAVTSEMRRRAKAINFGLIYGMGEPRLARELGITRQEAARFIAAYFERFVGVRRFMEQTVHEAGRGEAVRTLMGRRRFLPNLHSANRGLRFEAERVAKNTPIQGTAADILKRAMIQIGLGDVVPGARMVLTVHDELVFEVPEGAVEEAGSKVRRAMEEAASLDVPLVVDVGHGSNWGEAH